MWCFARYRYVSDVIGGCRIRERCHGALSIGLVLCTTALPSCATTTSHGQLSRRASSDLRCPRASLHIRTLDSRTRTVSGCDRQATYVRSCQRELVGPPVAECTWVLNSDVVAVRVRSSHHSSPPPRPITDFSSAQWPRQGASSDVSEPDPPATTSPGEGNTSARPVIRAAIDHRRDAILECTDERPVDLIGGYTAEGAVSFSIIGPLAGSDAERCVRDALGAMSVAPSDAPGAVTHRVDAGDGS